MQRFVFSVVDLSSLFLMWSFLQDGRTPLWEAASGSHSEVVSLLLERGADKEARDTEVSPPCC